jgi:hypothetical protein
MVCFLLAKAGNQCLLLPLPELITDYFFCLFAVLCRDFLLSHLPSCLLPPLTPLIKLLQLQMYHLSHITRQLLYLPIQLNYSLIFLLHHLK